MVNSEARTLVVLERPADLTTPVSVMRTLLAGDDPCFLLESVEGGARVARWSFLGTAPERAAQLEVRLKDIRQRSVANLLSGNLRVLEGNAVNQSATALSKIRVRLVISDAYDVVLGEKAAFCGNLLTDVELSTLAEPEIQRELSIPQGSDVANERIPPGGEIPFMIVFGQEQAGAIKTVVLPAGAERVP